MDLPDVKVDAAGDQSAVFVCARGAPCLTHTLARPMGLATAPPSSIMCLPPCCGRRLTWKLRRSCRSTDFPWLLPCRLAWTRIASRRCRPRCSPLVSAPLRGSGRGDLSQVYVEGDNGTVFLVSADDEAVLVAVGRQGAKVGLMLFEVKQAAEAVATCLRAEPEPLAPPLVAVVPEPVAEPVRAPMNDQTPEPVLETVSSPVVAPSMVAPAPLPSTPTIAPVSVMPIASHNSGINATSDDAADELRSERGRRRPSTDRGTRARFLVVALRSLVTRRRCHQ